ncbi:hypothetical protein SEA_RUMI_33 [Gordonia phage Rumi]|nr:hypothetical protein SEA_RUMI_33 [Gordonia phage Rumi]
MREVRLEDYDPPPHDGYWPDIFLINKQWVDEYSRARWRAIPNIEGMFIRKLDNVIEIEYMTVVRSYYITDTVLVEGTDVEAYELTTGE